VRTASAATTTRITTTVGRPPSPDNRAANQVLRSVALTAADRQNPAPNNNSTSHGRSLVALQVINLPPPWPGSTNSSTAASTATMGSVIGAFSHTIGSTIHPAAATAKTVSAAFSSRVIGPSSAFCTRSASPIAPSSSNRTRQKTLVLSNHATASSTAASGTPNIIQRRNEIERPALSSRYPATITLPGAPTILPSDPIVAPYATAMSRLTANALTLRPLDCRSRTSEITASAI